MTLVQSLMNRLRPATPPQIDAFDHRLGSLDQHRTTLLPRIFLFRSLALRRAA